MSRIRSILCLAVLVASMGPFARSAADIAPVTTPHVVVALIDTGINPYNVAFRDTSPQAYQHPCTYIPNYPCSATRLDLTLDAPDYATAVQDDDYIWVSVHPGQLYWVPGTRIIGLISMAPGGTRCPGPLDMSPINNVRGPSPCLENRGLDDFGHGTMTASRAAGGVQGDPTLQHSLAPDARIVEIEGLGADSVKWAADQGWIDVQSNSWAETVPGPASQTNVNATFKEAASKMAVFAASGNGTGGSQGFAPDPADLESTHAPGVISVGAHDNGRMALWSGSPPNVVADGYGGWMADYHSITAYGPDSVACCTSAASPYAAGGMARIMYEARRILGSDQWGIHNGVVAQAPAGWPLPSSGPLSDGTFTLDEAKSLLLHTAEAHPAEGRDDGSLQWTAAGRAPTVEELGRGPASNPYCNGCFNLPLGWYQLPDAGTLYPFVGYGAINERSIARALDVMNGSIAEPARPLEDQFFGYDNAIRNALAK
ncbi:MAG: S8/S53 family peptidase [Actinomycetota bacterium]